MFKEIAIFIYLVVFSLIFKIFNVFPAQKKVVFVASFAENNLSIYQEMKLQNLPYRAVFLANGNIYKHLSKNTDSATVLSFNLKHFVQFIISIFHLATAKIVFVDNYYGFLAAINFKSDVKCIQLWHANGAVKMFGLKDKTVQFRTSSATKRFKRVYNNFHKVVVSSDAMADIFMQAFGLTDERILRSGIPRTDLFFDNDIKDRISQMLYKQYPFLENKRIILYAPTFRDYQLEDFSVKLDLDLLKAELANDYILLIKLHPAIKNAFMISENLNGFLYDFSAYPNVNELLFITDLLITDYSSLPFEFSLLKKPMIFFPYDLDEYSKSRGLWENYEKLVPGPVTFSTTEIINKIKTQDYQLERIENFNKKWNTYSKGNSCKNILTHINAHMSENHHQ